MNCNRFFVLQVSWIFIWIFFGSGELKATIINVPTDQTTIQAAITAANSGDTVVVANGTYNENITIDKSITILAANSLGATIDGSGSTALAASNLGADIYISGFVLTTNAGTNDVINFLNINGKITIVDNVFSNFGHIGDGAVDIETNTAITTDVVIQDNSFSGGGDNEAYIKILLSNGVASNSNVIIDGNTLTGMMDDGIEIDLDNTGLNIIRVHNNSITGFTASGSAIDYDVNDASTNFLLVKDNTISDFESEAVRIDGGGTNAVNNFLIEENMIMDNGPNSKDDEAILVRTSSGGSNVTMNVTILNNTITDMGGDGIEIFLLSASGQTSSNFNILIDNNAIDMVGSDAGINLYGDVTNGNFSLNADITNNNVTNFSASCILVNSGAGTINLFESGNSCTATKTGVTTSGTSTVTSSNQLASLGDYIWNDLNGDGSQDMSEPGLAGISITAVGTGINQAVFTDEDGFYFFPALPHQNYTLTITLPTGYSTTIPDNGPDNLDNDFNMSNQAMVILNNSMTNVDAGLIAIPSVTFTAPADLCITAGLQSGLGGGMPIGGVYSGPGVTDDANGMTYSFDPAAAGIGVHTITYTESSGSVSDGIEVFALPIVTFTAPADLCITAGLQSGLGGGMPIGGVYSGPGVTDDANGMTYSFDPAAAGIGVHTLQYTYSNNGCSASASDNIEILTSPTPPFNSQSVCAYNTGLSPLQALAGGVYDLSTIPDIDNWYQDPGLLTLVTSPTEVPPGTYYGTVVGPNGCESNGAVLTVNPAPYPPIIIAPVGTLCVDPVTATFDLGDLVHASNPFDPNYPFVIPVPSSSYEFWSNPELTNPVSGPVSAGTYYFSHTFFSCRSMALPIKIEPRAPAPILSASTVCVDGLGMFDLCNISTTTPVAEDLTWYASLADVSNGGPVLGTCPTDGSISVGPGVYYATYQGASCVSAPAAITVGSPEGGVVALPGGGTDTSVCVGDGMPDLIFANSTGAMGSNSIWLVTDDNNILLTSSNSLPIDFEIGGVGVCRLWKVSYEGNLIAAIGDNISMVSLSDLCWDLSDNYITIFRNATPSVTFTAPMSPVCPNNVLINLGGGNPVGGVYSGPGVIDDANGMTYSFDGSISGIGTHLITYTFTNGNGCTSEASDNVTVEDNVPPMALCQNLTVYLDATGNITITPDHVDGGSSDACGVASLIIDDNRFLCSDIGPNIVILTVEDNNGNTATCASTVSVVDTTAPVAICQDISVHLNLDGTVTITPEMIDDGSYDNCTVESLSLDKTLLTCDDIGMNVVVLTVEDQSGNTDTCHAIVDVGAIIINSLPEIIGMSTICPGLSGIPYHISPDPDINDYQWSYSGSGVMINNNGSPSITIDFSQSATPGVLTVEYLTVCGQSDLKDQFSITIGSSFLCSRVNDCMNENLFVLNTMIGFPGTLNLFKASNNVSSIATIPPGETVLFRAGQDIDLLPFFEVKQGALFLAEIEGCFDLLEPASIKRDK